MSEARILKEVMLALSRGGARIFRNNTAQAWVGKVAQRTPRSITLHDPRPLHAGLCVGSSDLIGWLPVTITQDMVGQTVAVFLAPEVKAPGGRVSEAQERFLAAVRSAGGIAGIVRSPEDALDLLHRRCDYRNE